MDGKREIFDKMTPKIVKAFPRQEMVVSKAGKGENFGKKEILGKLIIAKAKPAKKAVKEFPVAALRASICMPAMLQL